MLIDDIYRQIGDFGRSQIILYLLLMMIGIPTGIHHVSITFLAARMDHWCHVPQLANLTYDLQRHVAIPIEATNGKDHYSKCLMYDLDYSQFSESDFQNWNRSQRLDGVSSVSCTSWTYDQSVFISTAVSKWDCVCRDSYLVSMAQSVYMAGVLVGCLGFGQLADSIGRKKTVVISSFFWGIAAIIATYVPHFLAFITFRFLVGACAAGAYTTAFVMCMEMIGESVRMVTGIMVQAWFAGGIMLLSGLSYIMRDFITLQIVVGVWPLIFVSYYWLVPESPRWLVTVGRDEEATAILRQMAKTNGAKLPDDLNLAENRIGHNQEKKAVLFDLFKTPRMRKITICMWIAWFTTSIVFYGLSLGVNLLGGSIFLNNFLVGLVEIPSYALTVVALRKIGRRWPTVVTFFISGMFCLIMIPFLNKDELQPALITFLMLAKGFGSAAFAILYVYAAELFPTVLRNVGVGSGSMMARAGGLIQPQATLLEQFWTPAPFVFYGFVSLVGGLVSIVFPETLGKKLPETLEEAENFGKEPELQTEDGTKKDTSKDNAAIK